MAITQSDAIPVLTNPWLILVAAPKTGKTVTAGTISEYFPREVFEGKRPTSRVVLKDTLYVEFDKGGLDSLAEWNIAAPLLDCTGWDGPSSISGIEKIAPEIREAVAKGGIKHVVFDSFSTLDGKFLAYEMELWKNSVDKRQMWGAVTSHHLRLLDLVGKIPASFIWNCHLKANAESKGDEKAGQSANRKALGLPSDGDLLVPEITGRGFRVYHAACSLVLPVAKSTVNGKTERFLIGKDYQGFWTSHRFQSVLDQKEPPDLRRLIEKVRSKVSAANPTENE